MSGVEAAVLLPEVMAAMAPEAAAAAAPAILPEVAMAAAPEALAAALPAGGMGATGGLLGTGASAFGGASPFMASLGADTGMMGAMSSAGMPASLASFSSPASAIGSFGLGDAAAYGAQPFGMGDRLGMMAKRMGGQNMGMMGLKMAAGSMMQPQQQMPHSPPNLQMHQFQPVGGISMTSDEQRKKRDQLLRQMLGIR